ELVERILDFGFFKTGANNIALKNRPTVKAVSLAKVGHDFEMELLATGYGVEKLENLRMVHRRVSQDFINIPLMPIEKGCFHVVIPSDTLSQLSNGKYKVIVGWEFLEEIYFKVTSIDFIALKKSGFSKTPSNYLEFTQQEYACKVVEAKLVDERVSLKIQVLPFQAKSYFLRLANLVDTNETIDFASVAVEGEIVSFLISISELPEDMRAIIQIHWGESQREMVKTEVDTLQGIQSSGFLRSINGNLSFLMESEH
ncbi:MAG: hypothetical protein LBD38_02680, partial [Streptococcaceae bacterium]|nr:hypothetical protein [Streptococcaceae bacterium]